jgi:hypothetical protein
LLFKTTEPAWSCDFKPKFWQLFYDVLPGGRAPVLDELGIVPESDELQIEAKRTSLLRPIRSIDCQALNSKAVWHHAHQPRFKILASML